MGAETNPEIKMITHDSRKVEEGALFFAIEGLTTDGHGYLEDAVGRGAAAIASERPEPEDAGAEWIQVSSIRDFMALTAHAFFGEPSTQLELVGITGTNGKTTTAFLLHQILSDRAPALMMGTIKTVVGREELPALLTTPEATEIQETLARGVNAGCRFGVLEVSSHALHFRRTFGCHFPIAVFTNLSQDHLDFHDSLEAYFGAKKKLFDPSYNPGLRCAVINGDDSFGRALKADVKRAVTFGFESTNDVFPHSFKSTVEGLRAELEFFGRRLHVKSPLLGRHNLSNLMAAAAAASLLEIEDHEITDSLRALAAVPGRFEKVPLDLPFTVVIDFAHTPDALRNVLELAREVTEGRVLCLFGCGGDRDREKRPRMGRIAAEQADYCVVTSDNPRTEPPQRIVEEIMAGVPSSADHVEKIVDRKDAIRRLLQEGKSGDLLVLAGKGHETYQDVGGRKLPFDERQIVREAAWSI